MASFRDIEPKIIYPRTLNFKAALMFFKNCTGLCYGVAFLFPILQLLYYVGKQKEYKGEAVTYSNHINS